MPRGDGTGPMGMGPMTGRAAGFCAGYGVPGYDNPVPGRGMGCGRGRGRGYGMGMAWRFGRADAFSPSASRNPYATPTAPRSEAEVLREQAKYFCRALEGINRRISELESRHSRS